MNVAETIKKNTRKHLENGGLFYGQCVSAVGWIGGSVPEMTEEEGIIELPTSDSSNAAIVCGSALAGRRPIYAIRYQGFLAYNAASLLNFAAKSQEMWETPCPVFVRGIGMEGSIGPVATGMHHSMVMRMPGFIVVSPMTPSEWEQVWNYYLENQQPVFCSEHRTSFNIDNEIENIIYKNIHPESKKKTKTTIFSIGAARLESIMAFKLLKEKNINVNVINLIWLKPLKISDEAISLLEESEFGIVIDSDFQICGAAEHIANFLMIKTSKPVYALGLEDRTSGFAAHCDNLTPNAIKIANAVKFEDFVI